MSAVRAARTVRSVAFLNTLLLTTAFTVPAFAQIETVVVTAERKAENIQTVPVAVTALTSKDLKSEQVSNFKDLQFHVPGVTYTKSNFGGAQFQIRGITTQFGLGAAIAQNLDDIYLEAPALVTGEYYDVDRVEIARGPQSTSYGRAATGGSVNVVTTKPNLDEFSAHASIDYGSFDTIKPDAAINIPIIDGELGVRVAIHGSFHDGYEKNKYTGPQIYPGSPVKNRNNSLGTFAGRVSVRWQPSADTTIDLVADGGYENDRRVRGDKQECHRDQSGVLGCLPDRLGFDSINTDATFGVGFGSAQGITALLNTTPAFGLTGHSNFVTDQIIGNTLGLGVVAGNGGPNDPAHAAGLAFLGFKFAPINPALSPPFFTIAGQSPQTVDGPGTNFGGTVTPDILTTNTAFNPKYKTAGATYLLNWQQKVTDWLSATLDLGYANGYQFTQQDYNGATPENNTASIKAAQDGFNIFFGGNGYLSLGVLPPPLNAFGAFALPGPVVGAYDSNYFNVPGSLPVSNVNYLGPGFKNYGGIIDTTRGGILTKTPFGVAYDEDWFGQRETTGELRFQTAFDGPLNFSAGAFFMTYDAHNQYWVVAPNLDYDAIALGAVVTSLTQIATHTPAAVGLVTALPTFDAEYRRNNIQSRSAFLEATYEVIPDELKLIAGARYNDDRQHFLRTDPAVGGGLLTDGFFPIGSTAVDLPVTTPEPFQITKKNGAPRNVVSTDLWTGRVSVQWSPKLSFTEQTNNYLTLSRGELAGGVNVSNISQTSPLSPPTYKPATVDAIEVGTKNTLLDGTLQANLTAWYYNYENYQVGIIANRQALTLNVPARLYGLEGEFLWQPTEQLAVNLSVGLTQSHAGTQYLADQRNPTAGLANSILVKDLTTGATCVVVPITKATVGLTPGDSSAAPFGTVGSHVDNFYLPNGGNAAIDAPFGVPFVNYGVCGGDGSATETALINAGFDYAADADPKTGLPTALHNGTGIAKNLHGNRLPQVPNAQVGIGGQYTFKLNGGYTLVPRVDYYWQSSNESRLWNDPVIDRVNAYDNANLQVQLNAPDAKWYAAVYAKNVFDKREATGIYLTDPAAALFTNVFAQDPRVIGVSLGANW